MILLSSVILVVLPMKFWQRFARMWICEIYWIFSNIYTVAIRAPTGNTVFLAHFFKYILGLWVLYQQNVPSRGVTRSALAHRYATTQVSCLACSPPLFCWCWNADLPMWLFSSIVKVSTVFNSLFPSSFETSFVFLCFSKLIASDTVNSLAKLKTWEAYCPDLLIPTYHRVVQSIFLPGLHYQLYCPGFYSFPNVHITLLVKDQLKKEIKRQPSNSPTWDPSLISLPLFIH